MTMPFPRSVLAELPLNGLWTKKSGFIGICFVECGLNLHQNDANPIRLEATMCGTSPFAFIYRLENGGEFKAKRIQSKARF